MHNAGIEYEKAVKAAQRYLTRQNVDSEEEGLKLAFIRAKERKEAAERLRKNFSKKLNEQFSAQHVAETRTRFSLPTTLTDDAVRKIAYNQRRRKQVDEAGSYEAWRAKADAEIEAALKTRLEQAVDGGVTFQSGNKENYAKMIEEAETAATNETLDATRRQYLESAIAKADRAIKARASGGKDAYVESAIEDMRQAELSRTASLKALSRSSRKEKEAGGDAWAALVNSSNRPLETRPNA
jgi:large subunit ribosomal protein L28